MKLLLLNLSFFSLFFSLQSKAGVNCTEYLRRQGAFSFHRFESSDSSCYLSIDPFNPPSSFIYRSYIMGGDGSLMVFNSFGVGDDSSTTGARVFYFFPRNVDPDISIENDHSVAQSATQGLSISFSLDQHRIVGMKGGDVIEASRISPSNAGGVEFKNLKYLQLDSGFHMGQDPTGIPSGISKFIDTKQQSCPVKNSEIFKYIDGNPVLKFTDSELKVFLAKRCPTLKVNY